MTKKQIWPALAFLIFQTSLSVSLLPASAVDDASNAALVDMIRHSNIVNPNYKLTVAVTAGEALITSQCKPKSSEADRKIQAVLIAKTAFESLPDNVQRVKLLLLDYDANDCSSITVKRAEVKLFGSGGLSQKELLDSLEITKTDNSVASTGSSVVDGPEQGARMLALGRIEKLKSQGANVSGYMIFFKQIEDAAKAGDGEGVKAKCAYLAEKLTDQEGSIKQIRTRTSSVAPKAAASSASPTVGGMVTNAALAKPTPASIKTALASRLDPSQLAAIDGPTVDVGIRQMAMNDKLQLLQSQGVNTSVDLALSLRVQSLLYARNVREANSLLILLERKYGISK